MTNYKKNLRLCYAFGAFIYFCWHDLGPLVSLEAWLTVNQYKDIPIDHLYPMVKYLYPDGSDLF